MNTCYLTILRIRLMVSAYCNSTLNIYMHRIFEKSKVRERTCLRFYLELLYHQYVADVLRGIYSSNDLYFIPQMDGPCAENFCY